MTANSEVITELLTSGRQPAQSEKATRNDFSRAVAVVDLSGYTELKVWAASMALFDNVFIGPVPPAPLSGTVRILLTIWCILLALGTLPALMLTGMAFDGGYSFGAYYSVVIVWLYPPLVLVAFIFRRRNPKMVWLPLLPVTLNLLSMATNSPR